MSGAGDGPCSIKQGGLGLFQFDAGMHSQTLSKYGKDVLTRERIAVPRGSDCRPFANG